MQDFVHFLETKHLFVYLLYILNNPKEPHNYPKTPPNKT